MNIVVMRPDALGDSLMTFPVLVNLREKYRQDNPHITFVGNRAAMPLAKAWRIAEEVFDYAADWDKVFLPEGIGAANVLHIFKQTDLVIFWGWETNDMLRQNLLKLGVKTIFNVAISKIRAESSPMHMVEFMAKTIGLDPIKPEALVLPYTGSGGFLPYHPPIVIQPGGGQDFKRWPAASFAALIDRLLSLQYAVNLLAGPAELEVLDMVRRQIKTRPQPGMLTVLKDISLLEVAGHLKQCGCYVGNDTGTSHLAALLGIPTLTLYGIGEPDIWRPLGPTVQVIQEMPLSLLPVQRVLDTVLRLYKQPH